MELAITQPFFELQTPDFAWKFVWIISANFEQNENLHKKIKKNVKSKKKLSPNCLLSEHLEQGGRVGKILSVGDD